VANPEAGVQDLSLEQIRQIYDGRITNLAEVGGNDLPMPTPRPPAF
jgi:phosphate transport system substrate-binding protein